MKTLTARDLVEDYGLSFSGTKYLTSVSKQTMKLRFLNNLDFYDSFDRFGFGAATGVDTYTGELIREYLGSSKELIVYVPAKRDKVDWSFENWADAVYYMPKGTTYKDRNEMLVLVSTALSAFPNRDEMNDPRSGTWQCVRQARAARLDILVNPLSSKETIWEPGSK